MSCAFCRGPATFLWTLPLPFCDEVCRRAYANGLDLRVKYALLGLEHYALAQRAIEVRRERAERYP